MAHPDVHPHGIHICHIAHPNGESYGIHFHHNYLHHNQQHLCDVLGNLLLVAVTAEKTDVILHVLQLSCCCLHTFSVSNLTMMNTGMIFLIMISVDRRLHENDRIKMNRVKPLFQASKNPRVHRCPSVPVLSLLCSCPWMYV